MPRPRIRRDAALWFAAATCCCALGPAGLHLALAAAAGTLFEAAPFLLAAELLPPRLGVLTVSAGCGCGRRAPGALSVAATAVCWIAFGPLVALGRLAAALALLRFGRASLRPRAHPGRRQATHTPDVFAELLPLAPCGAFAALAARALETAGPHLAAGTLGCAVLFAAGVLLGIVAPCATAAVAFAAALAGAAPPAAAGVLLTGGLIALPRLAARQPGAARCDPRPAAWNRAMLALALALLAARGAAGFVNPRFLPFAACGSVLALLGMKRPTGSAAAAAIPVLLLIALVGGSPQNQDVATQTRLEEAYAGEQLTFIGRAHRTGAATMLERSLITCCRADAVPVALRTSNVLHVPDGTWIRARGVLARSPDGLVLRTARWRPIVPPADPFLYR